jgi:hypothetical protein
MNTVGRIRSKNEGRKEGRKEGREEGREGGKGTEGKGKERKERE